MLELGAAAAAASGKALPEAGALQLRWGQRGPGPPHPAGDAVAALCTALARIFVCIN
jgi:hypothetical protein